MAQVLHDPRVSRATTPSITAGAGRGRAGVWGSEVSFLAPPGADRGCGLALILMSWLCCEPGHGEAAAPRSSCARSCSKKITLGHGVFPSGFCLCLLAAQIKALKKKNLLSIIGIPLLATPVSALKWTKVRTRNSLVLFQWERHLPTSQSQSVHSTPILAPGGLLGLPVPHLGQRYHMQQHTDCEKQTLLLPSPLAVGTL